MFLEASRLLDEEAKREILPYRIYVPLTTPVKYNPAARDVAVIDINPEEVPAYLLWLVGVGIKTPPSVRSPLPMPLGTRSASRSADRLP